MTTKHDESSFDDPACLALVDRIAIAMATRSGDYILSGVSIISESVSPTFGWESAELEQRTPVAVDPDGKEYFTQIRDDGRGQIEIECPFGTTTIIKFWIPEISQPKIFDPEGPFPIPAPLLRIITTDENSILGSLMRELREYAASRSESSETSESSYFGKRMEMLYGDWIEANHRKLARKKPRYSLNGWCSFSLLVLLIEDLKRNLSSSPFSLHSRLVDTALSQYGAGASHELTNVSKFKKFLFQRLKSRGLSKEHIEGKAEVIRYKLHSTGILTEVACAWHDPDLDENALSERAGDFIDEFRRCLGIQHELRGGSPTSGFSKAQGIMITLPARSIFLAGGMTGTLLCIWFLWNNWQEADLSPVLACLVALAALSPFAFLGIFYRKHAIERWGERTLGGNLILMVLHLLGALGGLITLIGAIALLISALVLSTHLLGGMLNEGHR